MLQHSPAHYSDADRPDAIKHGERPAATGVRKKKPRTSGSARARGWAGLTYRSSGVRPVCFAIRASIFGPISSPS
jgi:hypothetical protein